MIASNGEEVSFNCYIEWNAHVALFLVICYTSVGYVCLCVCVRACQSVCLSVYCALCDLCGDKFAL